MEKIVNTHSVNLTNGLYGMDNLVEIGIDKGIGIHIVGGLADIAVKESLLRTATAMQANGYSIPGKKIVINIAPADLSKSGSGYDLAIALGVIAASGQEDLPHLEDFIILGELGLMGNVRATGGYVQAFLSAKRQGKKAIIPAEDAGYLAQAGIDLSGPDVYGVNDLAEAIRVIRDCDAFEPIAEDNEDSEVNDGTFRMLDYGSRRAVEICAAGGHGLLAEGIEFSPAKLAEAIAALLPEADRETRLKTAAVYSITGRSVPKRRPVRVLEGCSSLSALLGGGGHMILPGEVSLANGGVLAINTDFQSKSVFEALRGPAEDGEVVIRRLEKKVTYPAAFIPVVNIGKVEGKQRDAEINKLGAYYDHLDVQCFVHPNSSKGDPDGSIAAEEEKAAREEVARARGAQQARYGRGVTNATVSLTSIEKAGIDQVTQELIETMMTRMGLSARAYSRIIRIARTVADLDGSEKIEARHVAEAAAFRYMDKIRNS